MQKKLRYHLTLQNKCGIIKIERWNFMKKNSQRKREMFKGNVDSIMNFIGVILERPYLKSGNATIDARLLYTGRKTNIKGW